MCLASPKLKGMRGEYHPVHRQGGAALVLALVVFGVVALLASSLSMSFLVSVRKVENQMVGQQAMSYLKGAEGLARSVILNDTTDNPDKDHISEGWLNQRQEYPMPMGVISGLVCDMQGRFNLNNLQDSQDDSAPVPFTADQELFVRLLQVLPLAEPVDLQQAQQITRAVIDWVDPGFYPRGIGGVEDYSDKTPAYRAANKAFVRVSELRWVEGITDEIYTALEPYVTALPQGVALNINTAGRLLIRSINETGNLEPLTDLQASNILQERDGDVYSSNATNVREGFNDVSDFESQLPSGEFTGSRPTYAVKSNYFLLQSSVFFQERVLNSFAVIRRDGNTARTIARDQSGLGRCDFTYQEASTE